MFGGRKKKTVFDSDVYSDREVDIKDKNEESKEIAGYLNLIRKRHDKVKEQNLKKKAVLEKLKKEYQKFNELAHNSQDNESYLVNKIDEVKKSLESVAKSYKNEIKDLKSYLYILDRMKKDKIAMEIKANSIQLSLKSTKYVLQSEDKKSQQIREVQFQSKMILKDIHRTFSQKRRKKNEYVSNLERELKSREDVALRRQGRQKRQMEIVEAAANDDKDSPEVKLREALLLFKVWFSFLNKKFTAENQKAIDVERAFSKIKSATGLTDVNDIVEKFLTREQNYLLLINAVTEAEKKLALLREENESAKEILYSLQFEDSKIKPETNALKLENRKKLAQSQKVYINIKEKLKNSSKIYDQLINWTEKILIVLKVPNEAEASLEQRSETSGRLLHAFKIIFNKLEDLTMPIKSQTEFTQTAMDSYYQKKTSDIIAEMSTDEAISKLVRVRIASIHSNDDDDDSSPDIKDTKAKNWEKNNNLR